MKIISWNVNGLRATHKKGAFDWLLKESPDIFCFQETKATPDQLPDEVRNPAGYTSYFNFPKEKKGYSGVGLYTKVQPLDVFYGMKKGESDFEGRIVGAEYARFYLLNVYFPNGGGGPDRLAYKLAFYDEFLKCTQKLRKKKPVIFCGDVNTAHTEIDLARPKENIENTGFLPIERAWIDEVTQKGYVDIYRDLHKDEKGKYTYWDMKTFARDRNVGWRIDYFFVSKELEKFVKNAEILTDVYGSDHCPIEIEIF